VAFARNIVVYTVEVSGMDQNETFESLVSQSLVGDQQA
jgi:hypothetical protein